MNERIQELYEQAMGDVREEAYPTERSWGMDDVMEKFAELIVRDCINISTKVDKNPYVPDHDQAKKIIREIKQHFGVE